MLYKKKKALFICNTPYQILVAMWIKHHTMSDQPADILISDHMNGGKEIVERLNQIDLFSKAFFVQTRDYSFPMIKLRDPSVARIELPKKGDRYDRMHPEKLLKYFFQFDSIYEELYIVNMDRFAQLTASAIRHTRISPPKIILFEDGTSTYSLRFKKFYESAKNPYAGTGLRNALACAFYRDFPIYGNISYTLVFNPDLMLWSPSENHKLDTIDKNDPEFLKIANHAFGYNNDAAEYDKKYIFFEESYFADGKNVGDVELVEELAKRLGKENMMVKIHPRNPINRFEKLGYKTNKNTSIPWEVICMNMPGLSGKVLITILSGSILEPAILFGERTQAYSLINFSDVAAKYHGAPYLERILYFYSREKSITVCKDLNEIQ